MNTKLTVQYEQDLISHKSSKEKYGDWSRKYSSSCSGQIDDVLPGTYKASVELMNERLTNWGSRNSVLFIVHKDYEGKLNDVPFQELDIDVGVDSGQAGFYDLEIFKAAKIIDNEGGHGNEPWYDSNCRLTLDKPEQAGVIIGGCVSSSGYGDGGYDCHVQKVDGKIVSAKIVFIDENEDEEEDEE